MFPVSDVIPSRTTPYVTIGLIALNAVIFAGGLRLTGPEMQELSAGYGSIPADLRWIPLLTSAFLHAGWIHFAGNMLFLWIFGENVEDGLGHAPFLLFYLSAAAIGAVAHAAVHPASTVPLVGASASVAAVMGAYFVLYPRSQVLTAVFLVLYLDVVEVPAVFFLGVWVLLQIVSGLTETGAGVAGGTAIAAHMAGFAAGGAVGLIVRRRAQRWDDLRDPARPASRSSV